MFPLSAMLRACNCFPHVYGLIVFNKSCLPSFYILSLFGSRGSVVVYTNPAP